MLLAEKIGSVIVKSNDKKIDDGISYSYDKGNIFSLHRFFNSEGQRIRENETQKGSWWVIIIMWELFGMREKSIELYKQISKNAFSPRVRTPFCLYSGISQMEEEINKKRKEIYSE